VAFVVAFSAMHALYFTVPDRVLRDRVHYYGIIIPGAAAVKLIAPDEPVVATKGSLRSRTATLDIVRGCDGAGMAFLLVAAVAAFPAPWKRKFLGLAAAVVVSYLLNQGRIVALYFVATYRNDWFTVLHGYFIPGFLIALCSMFFLWWTSWAAGGGTHGRAHRA
jgi:exosortase family protein XrtM